jgi:hypothetical protein
MEEESLTETSEGISDKEKQMITDMNVKRQLLLAQAESALAKNQLAEAEHRNLVLQLFIKYQLNPATDMIDENGLIIRGKKSGDQ